MFSLYASSRRTGRRGPQYPRTGFAIWTKLTVSYAWEVLPYLDVSKRFINFHPKRVAEFAAGNPVDWYKDFLENVVLPHAALFAKLQACGEAIVGITL